MRIGLKMRRLGGRQPLFKRVHGVRQGRASLGGGRRKGIDDAVRGSLLARKYG
jgi:hypothetical protein